MSDEMSFEDAVQELGDAVEADAAAEAAPEAPVVPAEQATPAEPSTPGVTPEPVSAAPAEPVDTETVWSVNPDELPVEVQPLARELLGTFTQKTQALAEQRKQFEQFGDLDQVARAHELYTQLQDPANLVALHEELSTYLQTQGLTPAQASAEAAQALGDAAQPVSPSPSTPSPLDALVAADPELAPLVEHVKTATERIERFEAEQARFESEQAQRAEQARQQHEYMALVGELQRQESVIRDMKKSDGSPVYTQEDVDEMYELSSFYNGNLLEAQTRFEAMRGRWAGNYFAQKEAVNANTPVPVGGGGGLATPADDGAADLDEALARAMDEVNATGETELAF